MFNLEKTIKILKSEKIHEVHQDTIDNGKYYEFQCFKMQNHETEKEIEVKNIFLKIICQSQETLLSQNIPMWMISII